MIQKMKWGSAQRLVTACDIAQSSIEWAAEVLGKVNDSPKIIVVPQSRSEDAYKFAETLGLKVIWLPDAVMNGADVWCLVGDRALVWSEGA